MLWHFKMWNSPLWFYKWILNYEKNVVILYWSNRIYFIRMTMFHQIVNIFIFKFAYIWFILHFADLTESSIKFGAKTNYNHNIWTNMRILLLNMNINSLTDLHSFILTLYILQSIYFTGWSQISFFNSISFNALIFWWVNFHWKICCWSCSLYPWRFSIRQMFFPIFDKTFKF